MASEEGSEEEGDITQLLDVEERERYEQRRRIEKENMIQQSKETAERLREQHAQEQEAKFVLEQEQMVEKISGFSLRRGRDLSDEQLQGLVHGQTYVIFDRMEECVTLRQPISTDYFTIGILCRVSPLQKSQNGKSYVKWDFTNLKKCAPSKEGSKVRTQLQCGYKVVTVFIYGPDAGKLALAVPGGVYVLFNPGPLPQSEKFPYALKVVSEQQLKKIGMALDFGLCGHFNPGLGKRCSNFVNTSWEKFCDLHIQHSITQIKSRRPMFQSEYIDLTQVRSNREPLLVGNSFEKKLPKASKKPNSKLTETEKQKFEKWQQEESTKLNSYMRRRSEGPLTNPLERIAKAQREATAVEIDMNEEPAVDSSFIQQLMAKKKKTSYSDKFGAQAAPIDAKKPKIDAPESPQLQIEMPQGKSQRVSEPATVPIRPSVSSKPSSESHVSPSLSSKAISERGLEAGQDVSQAKLHQKLETQQLPQSPRKVIE